MKFANQVGEESVHWCHLFLHVPNVYAVPFLLFFSGPDGSQGRITEGAQRVQKSWRITLICWFTGYFIIFFTCAR